MAQPDTRKYQLFPRDKQATTSPVRGLAPDQAFALAMGQNSDKADKGAASGLRLRVKEHGLPSRRRKISVPELGPMTTVHESSMDSRTSSMSRSIAVGPAELTLVHLATIPGRPAFHERSASAPGNGWKQISYRGAADKADSNVASDTRPPVSPKDLPPLMIPGPTSVLSPLKRQLSLSRLRSGSVGTEPSTRSAQPDDSPKAKTPYTPSVTTPSSASTTYSTMTTSTLPTPVSAIPESRGSPRSFKTENTTPVAETYKDQSNETANSISTPMSAVEPRSSSALACHRRNLSDSSSITGSIMDRGRPKKKSDSVLKRTSSKKSKSAERRAFETLPKGWKASDAVQMLDASETIALNKQALQQAERFEILRKADVGSLSRVNTSLYNTPSLSLSVLTLCRN